MKYLLGIDLGTSGVKAVLFNQVGEIIATDLKEYPLYCQNPQYAEQDPLLWWSQTKAAIKDVINKVDIDKSKIVSLGISGQMHGLVLLDEHQMPLCNSIIWCDSRSKEECAELEMHFTKERLLKITGNIALPAFTASKILWVKNHQPEILNKAKYITLPKDYLKLMLTGVHSFEYSDASGMQMMDINTQKWDLEILDFIGVKKTQLGPILQSDAIVGKIKKEVAKELGLSEALVVVSGAGDQAASALGNGIYKVGQVSCSLGSSGVVLAPVTTMPDLIEGKIQGFAHAVTNLKFTMGVTQGCGISMKWMKDLLYKNEIKPYEIIEQEAQQIDIGADHLVFLPYLLGERSPHLDPLARGVFFGLTTSHQRGSLARAVFEGISYSLLDCLNEIQKHVDRIEQIYLSGGGTSNQMWCQMLADIFQKEIVLTNSKESGALGVTILGSVAVGIYKDIDSAVKEMIKVTKKYIPNVKNKEKYQQFYKVYQDLYTRLKDSFIDLSECE